MKFFDHKDLGNHLLHVCPKVVKHPVYSLLLLGYKPVQHVTVLNTVGNCNTVGSVIKLYYNIIILWDHRRICLPSLTETSLRGAYL